MKWLRALVRNVVGEELSTSNVQRPTVKAEPVACAVVTTERPVWTQEDAEWWSKNLKSESGRKLLGILLFDEQAHNRSAVLRPEGFPYNAGFAAGYGSLARQFAPGTHNGFAALVRPEQDATTRQSEADALRERIAS